MKLAESLLVFCFFSLKSSRAKMILCLYFIVEQSCPKTSLNYHQSASINGIFFQILSSDAVSVIRFKNDESVYYNLLYVLL